MNPPRRRNRTHHCYPLVFSLAKAQPLLTPAINDPILKNTADVHPPQGKKLVTASVDSVSRIAQETSDISKSVNSPTVNAHLERVMRPKSLSGGMRKLGIALVATPDPFTGVPGVALIASSFIAKRNEPMGLAKLGEETRKILREMQSLRL